MSLDTATLTRLEADAAAIVARYPQARSALLPMLHLVQSEEGYVSPDGIAFCARMLDLTTAEVAAVATFYTQYKRHPNGTYTVGVCTNTLCAVMGGDEIFAALETHLGVGHDETTDDGAITLERVECNAACDYAPVMMVNWEFFDNQTPGSARDVVDALRSGGAVAPTRGANSVCSFKQMSRVLAGFPDGRGGEGVAAGPASLAGTILAREQGWEAPEMPEGRRVSGYAGGNSSSSTPTAGAAADTKAREATSSGVDTAVPAGTKDRAGTEAGKPPGEATAGEGDASSATDPNPPKGT